MAQDRFFNAEFASARNAASFALRITEGGWHIVTGSIIRRGKVVTWEWTGEGGNRSEYFQDMLETVGYYGSAPTGRKARMNGVQAPVSY